jgi:hypothetical protein
MTQPDSELLYANSAHPDTISSQLQTLHRFCRPVELSRLYFGYLVLHKV